MFEILGDLWVFDAVAAIGVYEPDEEDLNPSWQIKVLQRGVTDWVAYDFDSEEEAIKQYHYIATEWMKVRISSSPP